MSSSSSHSSALSPQPVIEKTAKSGRRTWSKTEEEALREAVRLYGSRTGPGSAWPAISKHVSVHGGRTNKVSTEVDLGLIVGLPKEMVS
jgi:hypothetical protein